MGKDNVPFHTVIFPATLLGTGEKWTMMKNISVTEYLNYEGGKFSKSRGTGKSLYSFTAPKQGADNVQPFPQCSHCTLLSQYSSAPGKQAKLCIGGFADWSSLFCTPGVFGNDAMDTGIPVEVWRYYLLANRPEQQDTDFMWDNLAAHNNNELLKNLVNSFIDMYPIHM